MAVVPVIRSGVRGQSVRSMLGDADWISVNSADSSVKMWPRKVFIEGPAGTQFSAGAGLAFASCSDGSAKWLERGPERVAIENVTAKTSSSFTMGVVLNFLKRGYRQFSLKRLSPD